MKNKQEKKKRYHNRHNLTHSHDNEMEGKRLLECKIDERKHKKDGLVGNKGGGKIRRGRKR